MLPRRTFPGMRYRCTMTQAPSGHDVNATSETEAMLDRARVAFREQLAYGRAARMAVVGGRYELGQADVFTALDAALGEIRRTLAGRAAARPSARRFEEQYFAEHVGRLLREIAHLDPDAAEIVLPRGVASSFGLRVEPGTLVLGLPCVEDDVEVPTARRR